MGLALLSLIDFSIIDRFLFGIIRFHTKNDRICEKYIYIFIPPVWFSIIFAV